MNRQKYASLADIQLPVLVLIFLLCLSVLLPLFSACWEESAATADKNRAVQLCRSAAETFAAVQEEEEISRLMGGNGETSLYYAGDTDALEENTKIACDVALVPVGGTYTMTAEEAADFVNRLKPACAVPVHYGSVVGDAGDGERFAALVDKDIRVELLIGK